jgi:hypothetical protein
MMKSKISLRYAGTWMKAPVFFVDTFTDVKRNAMKNIKLQKVMTAAALMAAMGYVDVVSAHTIDGALGTAAGAVDVLQTTCSKNASGATAQVVTKILAKKAGFVVGVQVVKGKRATHTNGTSKGYGLTAKLKGAGEGTYTLLVDKDKAGAVGYRLDVHCETKVSGVHSGQPEPAPPVQNQ